MIAEKRVETLLNKAAARWKVSRVGITLDTGKSQTEENRCVITGQCVAHDHPVKGWRAMQAYPIGTGSTLEQAINDALNRPINTEH